MRASPLWRGCFPLSTKGLHLKKIGKNNDFNDKNQLEIKTKQI